ncbi:MAG: ABC transporter substrate-binding protein [Chloroflexi bacterium]|nr:ABC transporter substrate-binding protein [Chloroflexota bacterium]
MNKTTKDELSSNGILRAAINMSNFLLVTDKTKDGTPIGVSPDMAQELADKLNLQLKLIPYTTPGEIADDAENDKWDICNIGAEPQRAEKINFSAAYAEIQATYIVQSNSKINNILDVDKIGNKICVASRTAYGLWLERNIHNAELIQVEGVDSSFDVFVNENLDALAGLRPALIDEVKKISGAKILEGQFMSVQQAIGTSIQNIHSSIYIAEFVEEMKKSGFVQKLIDKHNVNGRLSVAKLA